MTPVNSSAEIDATELAAFVLLILVASPEITISSKAVADSDIVTFKVDADATATSFVS